MTLKRQRLGTVATSAVSVLGLVGMGLVGGLPASAASKVVIEFAASPIANIGLRSHLISMFNSTHPGIEVKLISEPNNTDTYRAQLVTQISSGSTTPDVFMGDVIWPAQFGHAHLALALSRYLPHTFFKRFAPGLVQGASYHGHVYGAPFFMDAGFFYYRKDLLKKANLPVPHTWEQVVSDSKILQSRHLVKYGYVFQGKAYEGLTCDWMEFMTDAGGKVFGPGGKVAIDSPASLKALTFMRSLITSGISPAAETTFQEAQSMNVFMEGQSAFLRNWDYAYSLSQTGKGTKVKGDVGVEPMPTFQGQSWPGYSNIGGWNLYVNPHTRHLKQDLAFIDWMTGVKAQTFMATFGSEIPTNYTVQKSPKVRAQNPVLNIVSKVRLVPRPSGTPAYPKVSSAIYTNINAALAGSVSPAAALKAAAQGILRATHSGL